MAQHRQIAYVTPSQMNEDIGKRISAAMRVARAEGRPVGKLPAGYRSGWSPERGRFVDEDPKYGPLVREVFRLAASGKHSILQISGWLARRGWAGKDGRALASSSMHGLLHNRAYLEGFGDAPPLVTEETFYRAHGALAGRAKSGPVTLGWPKLGDETKI